MSVGQDTMSAVSSTTKLVWSEASSVVRNLTETVFPLYDDTSSVFCTKPPVAFAFEYVASVEVVVPLTIWTLVVS